MIQTMKLQQNWTLFREQPPAAQVSSSRAAAAAAAIWTVSFWRLRCCSRSSSSLSSSPWPRSKRHGAGAGPEGVATFGIEAGRRRMKTRFLRRRNLSSSLTLRGKWRARRARGGNGGGEGNKGRRFEC